MTILYFPSSCAGSRTPPLEAMPRSPVTASSRRTITVTIQAGTRGSGGRAASMMSTAATISLSASGSRSWPRAVVSPCRRASQPSRKSVRQATRNQAAAAARAAGAGQQSVTTSTGTSAMRSNESRFGSAVTRVPRPTASATEGDDARAFPEVCQAVAHHPGEVLAGFGNGGNATRFLDALGAGVVGSDGERQVPTIAIEEHPQMTGAALDVVAWEEDVAHHVQSGRFGHELHQSESTLGRDGQPVENRFRLDHRLHQRILDIVAFGNVADEPVVDRKSTRL